MALTLTLINPPIHGRQLWGDYVDIIGIIAWVWQLVLVLQVIIWVVTRPYMVFSNHLKNSTEKNDSNNVSKYYWKGIIDGENQEGEILAQSKEDASKQIRDKKVIITQLKLADDQRQDNTKPEKQNYQ